jgi:hypothetical protein
MATPTNMDINVTYRNDMGHYEPTITFPDNVTQEEKYAYLPSVYKLSWSATLDHVVTWTHKDQSFMDKLKFWKKEKFSTRHYALKDPAKSSIHLWYGVPNVDKIANVTVHWEECKVPGKKTATPLKDLSSEEMIFYAPGYIIQQSLFANMEQRNAKAL